MDIIFVLLSLFSVLAEVKSGRDVRQGIAEQRKMIFKTAEDNPVSETGRLRQFSSGGVQYYSCELSKRRYYEYLAICQKKKDLDGNPYQYVQPYRKWVRYELVDDRTHQTTRTMMPGLSQFVNRNVVAAPRVGIDNRKEKKKGKARQ